MAKIDEEIINKLTKDFENCKSLGDLFGKNGLMKRLSKQLIEKMLEEELTSELGYEKHQRTKEKNNRNGKSSKKVHGEYGDFEIKVPRDREGYYSPILVKKGEKDIGEFENKVISMYARGMTTRDIQEHVESIYGISISPTTVSNITTKVEALVKEWQSRPLEDIYIIVYFDAIFYKVREEGKVVNKAAYTAIGIDKKGYKQILGLWLFKTESSRFWLSVLTELQDRGIKDILIISIDGLKGFKEAIETIYPDTEIQQCVIHQIRNSLKYVPYKEKKDFAKDLKLVYKAITEEEALYQLDELEKKWGEKYPYIIKSWRRNWDSLSTYFNYSEHIRKLIYTTNIIEGVHRQFRKVTKNRSVFTNDKALMKLLYLTVERTEKKMSKVRYWSLILSQLSVRFEGRLEKYLK